MLVHAILEKCRPLYEYSWFIQQIKNYSSENLDRDTAITLAIQHCINSGIFSDFVQMHGSETVNMLFTHFNMEDAMKVWYREGVEDGGERGIQQGETLKLIDQICRKLRKSKTPEMIAEKLDESLETVQKICAAADKCGPEANTLEIYGQLLSMN